MTNFDGISGVQFTLEWDASVLSLVTEDDPNNPGTTVAKVRDSQGSPFSYGGTTITLPFFEGKNFNYPVSDLSTGSDIPGKATFLWSEQDQPSVGRTFDDDASIFTIYFSVLDASAASTLVSIGNDPTDFKFAPGAGGTVEAYTFQAKSFSPKRTPFLKLPSRRLAPEPTFPWKMERCCFR